MFLQIAADLRDLAELTAHPGTKVFLLTAANAYEAKAVMPATRGLCCSLANARRPKGYSGDTRRSRCV
jgi:hypothetical protein